MDAAFLLEEQFRSHFFRSLMQSFGCTYFCLWSYFPQTNCLLSFDGYYDEGDDQPSTSSGSLASRLFREYQQSVISLETDHLPGLAFRNARPYMELRRPEFQRLSYSETQRRFYQEARIQTAVFMGCRTGEIELGLSKTTQVNNLETGMRELFPDDFMRSSPVGEAAPPPGEQNRPSSSSSSLRSLDSPSELSPFIFNIQTTSHIPETLAAEVNPPLQPLPSSASTHPHQDAMQAVAHIRSMINLPSGESEEAAMTRAILAVLTSPSSSTSSSTQQQQPHQQQNLTYNYFLNPKASAFKRYSSGLSPRTQITGANLARRSMLKRAISYYQRLNVFRREQMIASRPTSTQLHHMISERKRREKLNESFQALRSLLPPGTKKDKASVLTSAREYLTSLKTQIAELTQRNKKLEAKGPSSSQGRDHHQELSGSSNERITVRVTHVSEPSSEERIIDLSVIARGECPTDDLVIRLLEFLKQANTVSLMSMEARTQIAAEAGFLNLVNFTLKIEGEWDEAAFQEAIRRVAADVAH